MRSNILATARRVEGMVQGGNTLHHKLFEGNVYADMQVVP